VDGVFWLVVIAITFVFDSDFGNNELLKSPLSCRNALFLKRAGWRLLSKENIKVRIKAGRELIFYLIFKSINADTIIAMFHDVLMNFI